jgi:hypothetical protein
MTVERQVARHMAETGVQGFDASVGRNCQASGCACPLTPALSQRERKIITVTRTNR